MLKSIRCDQVRLGMYIHAFEGSWLRHPFWRRRFLLSDADDLVLLLDSDVPGVVIDTGRGLDVAPPPPPATAVPPSRRQPTPTPRPAERRMPGPAGRDRSRSEATKVVNRSRKAVQDLFDGARLGRAIRSEAVLAVVDDIASAMEHNRHALLKVLRLKSKDQYTYLHSVAVCALMVNLARHLGLSEQDTADLGTAGLLHDVGKMTVPLSVLNKPARLSDEEFALMKTHPEQGWRLLRAGADADAEMGSGVPAMALDVCRHHHEKIDGTGYPHRLKGDEISLAARMGAICDVYDALTSNRVYKDAWEPVEAISRMREWDGHFDPALLFRFMQSVGVFPVGMLVQLRSNRLGIVLPNGRRASRPSVLAFFSTRERVVLEPQTVTIGDDLSRDGIVAEADPVAWQVPGDVLEQMRGMAVRQTGAVTPRQAA